MPERTAFYAYPSQPEDLTETIEQAITEISGGGLMQISSWRPLAVSGRLIIEQIVLAIDQADVFACDLTYLNPNVLFELGYAIGQGKRIWASLNNTI
jgi:nucleoside 2-deoxyribosyltransferase